jgi:hypothetical protein
MGSDSQLERQAELGRRSTLQKMILSKVKYGLVQGVRVELELGGSTGWIESEEVDALVAPLATAAQRKLPTELLCSDEAACAQRCAKAFLAVKVTLKKRHHWPPVHCGHLLVPS